MHGAGASGPDGAFVDASPFQAARDGERFRHPVEEHGATLRKHGFNYAGSETMVSGFTGEAFDVDIYVGLVYYQRLRHMVSDKSQVRATGPTNSLTRQPVKGRKNNGGTRDTYLLAYLFVFSTHSTQYLLLPLIFFILYIPKN